LENNTNKEENLNQQDEDALLNPLEQFNLGLFIYVFNKTVVWVVLITIISIILSLLYIRYVPRIYESKSTMLFLPEKKAQILGVDKIAVEQDANAINREIQLLKSPLLIERVTDHLNLYTGYYKEGNTKFVSTELYTSCTFNASLIAKNDFIYNKPIYLNIINQETFSLSYTTSSGAEYDRNYSFGQNINTPDFKGEVLKKVKLFSANDLSGIFYVKLFNKPMVVSEITNNIQVDPLDPKTKSFSLICHNANPQKAKDITQTIGNVFLEYDLEKKKEGFGNIISFIIEQIDSFDVSYSQFEDSISALRAKNGYIGVDGSKDLHLSLNTLQSATRAMNIDLNTIKLFKKYILTNQSSYLPVIDFKQAGIDLSTPINKINDLQLQRNLALLDVTPEHPKIKLLDKQMTDGRDELLRNVDNAIIALQSKLNGLNGEYSDGMGKLIEMPQLESEFNRLNKIRDSKEKFYLNLMDQRSNYMIANAGVVSDYIILQKAALPASPISPNISLIRLAGLLIGLIIGLIIVIIRYMTHKTIISTAEIEFKSKAPILGVVPSYNENLERSQIVVTKDPKSTISEAFRAIRSNLQFIDNSSGPKVVSTTSTIPGEGKTFMALNIAAILSMLDKKVIILDCDMRKPRLNKIFELDNSKGMSSILSGQVKIQDCIENTNISNIDVVTSGPVPPNPSELILLPTLRETVEYLKTKYDYVVIDTPPVGLVTDALEIMAFSDYPIYILRAAYSNRSFIVNINKLMIENNIKHLSCILNDFGRGASSYGYYYGYGQGYGYGYGYGYGQGYGYGSSYGYGYYGDDSKKKKGSFIKRLFSKF
jgi:capsular exopolysaccharide synthesis family protein